MDASTAKRVVEALIQAVTREINDVKSQVVGEIAMQVAIYAHDNADARRPDFGVLSTSPSLDEEFLGELEKTKALLLDSEQRRNALKHLLRLIEDGNTRALQLLRTELARFFQGGETYEFLLAPAVEYPNEYIKPYPYTGQVE